jgi:hypothetical protein
MPSQILHVLFGEDVIGRLYDVSEMENCGRFSLRFGGVRDKIFREYRGAFTLGCQGPDIFYHSQRHKPAAVQYGSLLHRRGFGVFAASLLKMALSSGEIDSLGSYALGFMTHAALDRFCHPYIIYFCGEGYHSFFERIIDVLMLKELRRQNPVSLGLEEILAGVCEHPPPGLKEFLERSLAAAFPERANKDRSLARRIDNAFIDCARFYRVTSPVKIKSAFSASGGGQRTFTRRALSYVYPENLPAEIDFLNLNHNPWRYPYIPVNEKMPLEDNRSFLEIYSDAVNAAVDNIAPCVIRYMESGEFSIAEAAEKIGNNGLSIQNEEEKPCAPNLTDPLPLADVMNEQAKYRGVE